jgi:2-polyprenyl-3-methyl-5-hydroxy-6-metoxy-1,4-benzoquinol methylase
MIGNGKIPFGYRNRPVTIGAGLTLIKRIFIIDGTNHIIGRLEGIMIKNKHGSICSHRENAMFARYGSVDLILCTTCGLVFTSPLNKKRMDASSYNNFYKTTGAARFSLGVESLVRLFRLGRAAFLAILAPDANTILDVGSGRGWMLNDLKKKYFFQRTTGIQVSRPAVDFSRKELGLEIFDRDLLEVDFGRSRFDIVTMWHVLEHVQHPQETIRRIHELLNPSGLLVIEVPNLDSWTSAWTLPYWLGLDPDYHLTFFTPSSLISLLERNGFEIKRIRTFSLEYSTFISAQSILSRITRKDQVFFRWLQNPTLSGTALIHLILFGLLALPCLVINLALFFTLHGEVLRVVARRRSGPPMP